MARRLFLAGSTTGVLLALVFLLSLLRAVPVVSAPSSPPVAWQRVDEDRLLVTFSALTYQVERQSGQDTLTVPGFELLTRPGAPRLPVKSILLAVPPEGPVEVRVVRDEWEPLPGTYRPPLNPRPAPLEDDLVPGPVQPVSPAELTAGFYPSVTVQVGDPVWVREQRLIRLMFFPFQYDSATGALRWHRRVQVEVRFQPPPAFRRTDGQRRPGQDDPFEAALRGAVLNADMVGAWAAPRPPALPVVSRSAQQDTADQTFKIVVNRDGIYRITCDALRSAGLAADADPRTFALSTQGEAVAIRVVGEADGSCDPGDYVEFYGQKFRGDLMAQRYAALSDTWLSECPACRLKGMFEKYTDENVYWLTVGGSPGPRMAERDASPGSAPVPSAYRARVRAEEANHWWTHHFGSEDTWFWDRLQSNGSTTLTRTYGVTLTGVAGGGTPATLRAEIGSRTTAPGHVTGFSFNGQHVLTETWDGKGLRRITATLPVTQLQEGVNQLDFVLGPNVYGRNEDIYFNWFEVEYDRRFLAQDDWLTFAYTQAGTWQYQVGGFGTNSVLVYDITSPFTPTRLTGVLVQGSGPYTVSFQVSQSGPATYTLVAEPRVLTPTRLEAFQPSGLKSPSNGADYIIITHRDFLTAAQELADYRAAQGLRTLVVDVATLYDEFNDGIYHPIAIRNFLAYASASWQPPAPRYVVLIGGGHWNFKGDGASVYGSPPPIYMPPNLAFVDPWQGEVDSANLLAAFAGDDILPDVVIGRIPVESEAELRTVIDKIKTYEAQPWEPWRQNVVFVADDVPDDAGDFVALSEGVISDRLPSYLTPVRLYFNDFFPGCSRDSPCPAFNRALTETLNTTGTLFLNFIGHASVQRWANEQLFTNNDIPSLANGDKLPILLSMTCLDGYWIHPTIRPSLAVELLTSPKRGIVAAFSPTGLGVATGHDVLHRGFYEAFFDGGTWSLAEATLAAKLAVYASGANYDLINTFTIFGDPALRVPSPFNVSAVASPPTYITWPGASTVITVNAGNLAPVTDTVQLVVQPPAGWPVTQPVTRTLKVSSTVPLTVTVAVPLTASVKTHAVTATVTSLGDRNRRTALTLTVVVRGRTYLPLVVR